MEQTNRYLSSYNVKLLQQGMLCTLSDLRQRLYRLIPILSLNRSSMTNLFQSRADFLPDRLSFDVQFEWGGSRHLINCLNDNNDLALE